MDEKKKLDEQIKWQSNEHDGSNGINGDSYYSKSVLYVVLRSG